MKRFAVIGLGNFGFYVTKTLFEEGHEVIAIDKNRDRIQSIDQYSTEAIVLDASNKDSLKSLGLEDMDGVIVCTGTKISESIIICHYLHEMSVKKILVKAFDDDHAIILNRIGATDIIFPERDMAKRVARNLSRPNVLDFIPLSDQFDLIQIEPPKEFIGKTIRELNLRAKYNVHIIAIKQKDSEEFILIPQPEFSISDTSILVLLGKSTDIKKVKAIKKSL